MNPGLIRQFDRQTRGGQCQPKPLLRGLELNYDAILVLHGRDRSTTDEGTSCPAGNVIAAQVLRLHKVEHLARCFDRRHADVHHR